MFPYGIKVKNYYPAGAEITVHVGQIQYTCTYQIELLAETVMSKKSKDDIEVTS